MKNTKNTLVLIALAGILGFVYSNTTSFENTISHRSNTNHISTSSPVETNKRFVQNSNQTGAKASTTRSVSGQSMNVVQTEENNVSSSLAQAAAVSLTQASASFERAKVERDEPAMPELSVALADNQNDDPYVRHGNPKQSSDEPLDADTSTISNEHDAALTDAEYLNKYAASQMAKFAAKSAQLAITPEDQGQAIEASTTGNQNTHFEMVLARIGPVIIKEHITDDRPTITVIADPELPISNTNDSIFITDPPTGFATNASNVLISGTIKLTRNLNSVKVNGNTVSHLGGTFSANVPLQEGFNTITAIADYGRRSFSDVINISVDTNKPAVVSAISTSSTSVLVQFNEAMHESSISNTAHFSIIKDDNSNALPVISATFSDSSNTTVVLQTGLQSNSSYTVTVANVKDLAGNPILEAQPETPLNFAQFTFIGTNPTGSEIVDSDGDGLLDHVELNGWTVIVTRTDGSTEHTQVNSDPALADTNDDGISDYEERHGGMDPRNNDTDGDTLTDYREWNEIYSDPTKQDTDGDGIQDGFEYLFFKTSPILADTDGDQIDDPAELSAGNRNPLVADLPSPDIDVGSINMQLDSRFTFTDSQGQTRSESETSEATLTQSENDSLSSSNENSTSNTLNRSLSLSETVSGEYNFGASTTGGFGARATVGFSVTSTQSTEEGSSRGATVQFGEESSRASEEAYHDSLTASSEVSTDETVVRELIDAAVRVDLSIDNAGDIPFTISNLELTALTQNPNNRRELIPVASLTPQNTSLGSVNIGALGDTARGPFVFSTQAGAVFPDEVQQLLKNPRGLIVQLANFDIVDEEGNNFAFTSQQVLDRTAGVSFDLGDGRTERFRIATASDHNEATGLPSGITMKRALEIIGLTGVPTLRDGGNGRVDSIVGGDDVVVAEFGTFVEPLTVIAESGENGVLDIVVLGGDDQLVAPNYETTEVQPAARIIDGGNGRVDTVADSADFQVAAFNTAVLPGQLIIRAGDDTVLQTVVPADPANDDILLPEGTPREVLTRFRDVEANSENAQFWVLFTQENVEAVDLDSIVLRSGEQYNFSFIQDNDLDGVWAREEYLHGSSDLRTNTDGCSQAQGVIPPVVCDTLPDQFEIQEGWHVQLRSSPQGYRVYSNPNQGDSDRDKLLDHEEFACSLDPRQRDTDLDGLTDWEELMGMRIDDSGLIIPMVSRDPATNEKVHDILPYSGANGALIEHVSLPACDTFLGGLITPIQGFATDPLNADTDGDRIDDARELSLGLNPNDPADGPLFLDDDGDGIPNLIEETGYTIIVNNTSRPVTSNPNKVDSDDDGLPDLLESFLMTDPRNPDTDGDGISDRNEYKIGGDVCVISTPSPAGGQVCTNFSAVPSNDYNAFENACISANNCDLGQIEAGIASSSPQWGTSLVRSDTDGDGLTDLQEVGNYTIFINRDDSLNLPGTARVVTSDRFLYDTDNDGLSDGNEIIYYGSDPGESDTDGDDGVTDLVEALRGRDPAFQDKRVEIGTKYLTLGGNSGLAFVTIEATASGGGNCTYTYNSPAGNYGFSDTNIPNGYVCTIVSQRIVRNRPGGGVTVTNDGSSVSIVGGIASFNHQCPGNSVSFTYGSNLPVGLTGTEVAGVQQSCGGGGGAITWTPTFQVFVD